MEDGILIGCDYVQEWLLPWWWDCYRACNDAPVAFADFGMSPSSRSWCEKRGICYSISRGPAVAFREEVHPGLVKDWEERGGTRCWDNRNAWFKKPLACQKTPFQRTVWLDLDCEVRAPLSGLFSYCDAPSGIALFRQKGSASIYNGGVICFRRGLPLIDTWAEQSFHMHHLFEGDQELLSCLIFQQGHRVEILPECYNCSRTADVERASIIHWHGPQGKAIIRQKIVEKNLEELYSSGPFLE